MDPAIARLQAARAQFPVTRERIYFDIANTNPPPLPVTRALGDFFVAAQLRGGDKKA